MPRATALGSIQDVERRVRRFFRYWEEQVESIPTKGALGVHDIDVAVEYLLPEAAQYYNTPKVFNASGFVARGLYPEAGAMILHRPQAGNNHIDPFVLHNHQTPFPIVRCFPSQPRSPYQQDTSNQPWLAAERLQFRPEWMSPGHLVPRALPKFFCLPRCITFHSTWGHSNPSSDSPSMQTWMSDADVAFSLESELGDGIVDHWEQLPGTPDLADERKQGSPNSPLLTPFRLKVMRDAEVLHTYIVVFRIVESDGGYVRPWQKTDPLVPQILTPSTPHEIVKPRHHPGPMQPHVHTEDPGLTSGAYLGHYSIHPHPPPHSLSHRQRYIYQQTSANGGAQRF